VSLGVKGFKILGMGIKIRTTIWFTSDRLHCKGPLCVRFFKGCTLFEVLKLSLNDLVAFWLVAESASKYVFVFFLCLLDRASS